MSTNNQAIASQDEDLDAPFTQSDVEFKLDMSRHDFTAVKEILENNDISDNDTIEVVRCYMIDANVRSVGDYE